MALTITNRGTGNRPWHDGFMRSTCTVKGCSKFIQGRGLCPTHYYRWRRNGTTDLVRKRRRCIVRSCGDYVMGHGFCQMHYARRKRTGSPHGLEGRICRNCEKPIPPERRKDQVFCSYGCYSRDRNLHRYGINAADYNATLRAQNGGCAICKGSVAKNTSSGRQHLHVDHCHVTGTLRGILCDDCNHGLGKFHDSLELLAKAIDYLTDPPGVRRSGG